jgi:hypothetical protein
MEDAVEEDSSGSPAMEENGDRLEIFEITVSASSRFLRSDRAPARNPRVSEFSAIYLWM